MSLEPYTYTYATWEFSVHGESQLMQRLEGVPLGVVFDVGCNRGYWSRLWSEHHPESRIHLFDLNPEMAFEANQTMKSINHPWAFVNGFGLGEQTGLIDYQRIEDNDRVSTRVLDLHHDNSSPAHGLIVRGEDYCQAHDIYSIDFLKIDTEGSEMDVLRGLGAYVLGRTRIISFEYGFVNVLTKNLLIDYWKLLSPLGFIFGRLTPEGVDFIYDYNLMCEDFHGPDYVAVQRHDTEIIERISRK